MNNKNVKAYVRVDIGGKERIMKLDYNAVADLEDYYGKGLSAIMNEEQIGFKLVRAFYWAGLKWKEPGLTLQRIGNMLGEELKEKNINIMDLFKPCMDALKKSGLMKSGKDENAKFDNPDEEESTDTDENEDTDPNE